MERSLYTAFLTLTADLDPGGSSGGEGLVVDFQDAYWLVRHYGYSLPSCQACLPVLE